MRVDLAHLSYSCRHDGKGRPVQPPIGGVPRREVDGECPECRKAAELRAAAEEERQARERRLANLPLETARLKVDRAPAHKPAQRVEPLYLKEWYAFLDSQETT
jgi:hypothetical protein